MKKFSALNEKAKAPTVSIIAKKVEKLLETLTIEIDGESEPWSKKITIAKNEQFTKQLTELVSVMFEDEKKALLESAKNAILTHNVAWIYDELALLNEAKKDL